VAANSAFSVRVATADDAVAIACIHNQGIADRIATFATEPRTVEQVAQQVPEKGERFPTVVVALEGQIIAWAAVGAYRDRASYAGVGAHSVDVDRSARGRDAGRIALDVLCRECAARGFWKLVSRIFPENEALKAVQNIVTYDDSAAIYHAQPEWISVVRRDIGGFAPILIAGEILDFYRLFRET
jgi:L-amino acid N-acyltransferase YncA